ncbi:B12-binding domain-containing protein [Streptomyces xinghaiensis]|uniref:cobalamin B12-binding domain-containing protein n=1 Tax=Streptomyces xinghaiensis TaxID=1038928 RepID=UPI002E0F852C|nr:cobalamin-dependent protein [Streptomyces xinghaiensis]WSQ70866.1 cobalamin-dependent protein [Streptomyces xinghaiensis]
MTAGEPGNRHPGPAAYARELWEAVVDGDEYAATRTALAALDAGLDAESVLLDVIGAVQRKVGVEWAANRMSVAGEHAATAINDRVIAVVAHHGEPPRAEPRRGRLTVACVDGEWHALPARLLAEVLKLRGWRVDYLGAQVPAPHLIAHLHRTGPEAVALSGSLATRLPIAHATIMACQGAGVPVLVGGAAFGPDGRYARLLHADAWAPDARSAADRLADDPPPPPRPVRRAVDDLPHLADQEYTRVSEAAPRLVEAVLDGLERRLPETAGLSGGRRRELAEDIAHLVDYLAAALYTDDAGLFTGYVLWTAEVSAARDADTHHLPTALDVLDGQLGDCPRARRLLDRARRAAGPMPTPAPAPTPASGGGDPARPADNDPGREPGR